MKHLRLFKTESEYNSATLELPNVSYVEGNDVVYYHPTQEYEDYVMVDLGLPSGLLWADRNIGAASPEDFGLYFAWGDTVGYTAEQIANGEKNFASDWSDYFDTTDGGSIFNKYATDKLTVLQPEDDAATFNMGSEYRMPTQADFNELRNNCTVTFIDLNGNEFNQSETESGSIAEYNLKGIKFTGSNGNSIFIPASGHCNDAVLDNAVYGGHGSLWSSSLDFDDSMGAYHFYFYSYGGLYVDLNFRYFGRAARGVK